MSMPMPTLITMAMLTVPPLRPPVITVLTVRLLTHTVMLVVLTVPLLMLLVPPPMLMTMNASTVPPLVQTVMPMVLTVPMAVLMVPPLVQTVMLMLQAVPPPVHGIFLTMVPNASPLTVPTAMTVCLLTPPDH